MERLIKIKEVMDRVGLSRSAIYRFMEAGDFPLQIKQSNRSAAWVSSEVDQWVRDRITASRKGNR